MKVSACALIRIPKLFSKQLQPMSKLKTTKMNLIKWYLNDTLLKIIKPNKMKWYFEDTWCHTTFLINQFGCERPIKSFLFSTNFY